MDEESSGGNTHLNNANESGGVSSILSVYRKVTKKREEFRKKLPGWRTPGAKCKLSSIRILIMASEPQGEQRLPS